MSFLLFRVIRSGVRVLIRVKNRISAGKPGGWMGLSEFVAKPVRFAFLVVTAPRWNCHATIALTDSFRVDSKLSLEVLAPEDSAQASTYVIYPEHGKAFTPAPEDRSEGKISLTVSPGLYRVGGRYYESVADPVFPEIRADDEVVIPRRCLEGERDRYRSQLESIRGKKSRWAGMLHYYMYYFLRWGLGGDSFLKREFLPVGNPDTTFEYDAFRSGDEVEILATEAECEQRVFLTCFNRHSFPVIWEEIGHFPHRVKMAFDGFYLLRRVRLIDR